MTMVECTRYPWVRVYVCGACAAPAFDCRSHPVTGRTRWRFMTRQTQLWQHQCKYHRSPAGAPALAGEDVDDGYPTADNADPPPLPLALHPQAVPPSMTRWLLADFEDTPATHPS
jgi:hypothetical protein